MGWTVPVHGKRALRADAAYDAGETTEKLQIAGSHGRVVDSSRARARAMGEWVESNVMIEAYG